MILKVVKNECQKVAKEDTLLEGLKNLMIHMETTNTANMDKLCGKLTKDVYPRASTSSTVSKVVKLAKVPKSMKGVSLET